MQQTLIRKAFNYYNSNISGKSFRIVFGNSSGFKHEIVVRFSSNHFKHLFGFQYLKDIAVSKMSPKTLYYNLMQKNITQEDIEKSAFYADIESRLKNYKRIIEIIKNGKVVYDGPSRFLGIEANYLMYIFDSGILYHLFYIQTGTIYTPCSFFPRNNPDYIKGHKMFSVISCTPC